MSKLKRLLPKGLKQFLWFVFKAPQRKIVGFKTWLVDLKGWFSRGMGNGVPGDITICVGLKNRSKHFLEHFLQSLNEVQRTDSFRLSIVDCGSDDIENLESEIRNNWAGVLHFEQKEQEFSRSEVFNKAIKNADTELVFICDADMQLPSDLYFSIKKYVQKRCAWFPVVYHLNEDGNSGQFRYEGKGLFAASKSQLSKTGLYDEQFRTWGSEDWELFFRFYQSGIQPFRTFERGLVHQYHKSLKPEGYQSYYHQYGY